MRIPFGDLSREYGAIKKEIDDAVGRVLASGRFILGEEVRQFERSFADYLGVSFCVSCASGTDALALALRALGIMTGDEVITQTNTCAPTVCGIINGGAKPVFCDVIESSAMIDPQNLRSKITNKTRAIIPVNLYGAAADFDQLSTISQEYAIPIIEDCAQSHGSTFRGKRTGTFGVMGCFSFYPTKNLGCYGDGGAVVTNREELYESLVLLRNYGQEDRYLHKVAGFNSRLDELQAGILNVKLRHLDQWNRRRKEIALFYEDSLRTIASIETLEFTDNIDSVYHLYIIRIGERQRLQEFLASKGISTLIHYPVVCHLQESFANLGYKKNDFPIAERLAGEILSFPLHPYLSDEETNYIAASIREFYGK